MSDSLSKPLHWHQSVRGIVREPYCVLTVPYGVFVGLIIETPACCNQTEMILPSFALVPAEQVQEALKIEIAGELSQLVSMRPIANRKHSVPSR